MRGQTKGGDQVSFGEFGLKALEPCWITSRQIEAVRVTISRAMSRTGKMWIRIFPDKPITKKPAETRMGKGKGEVEFWAAPVKPGTVLFELGGVPEEKAKLAFKRVAHKMPIKVKLVRRLPTT
jgi:large subunit ribosomal protein L16